MVATTTMVVHAFFYVGRMHGVDEPDVPPAPASIPEAPPIPPLAPWDLPVSLLPDIEMEPMSLELPFVEILPPPVVLVVELSSTTTLVMIVVSPLNPEYHPSATPIYEEDPSEELSTATSHIARITKPSMLLT